jgi:proteic killer suppression protein
MIKTFADHEAEIIFGGGKSKKLPRDVQLAAGRKLLLIHAAERITDLQQPNSNRLHKLTGDRAGQWSVSINSLYRVCFNWVEYTPEDPQSTGDAYNVQITNYH